MNKPSLLYVSPFPPEESGISDYSECLINYLADFFDITLYIDDYRLSNKELYERYNVVTVKEGIKPYEFAYRLYNIGNNPFFHSYIYQMAMECPGTIILHDYIIYFLFAGFHLEKGDFYSALYKHEGKRVFLEFKELIRERGNDLIEMKDIASVYPLNRELLSSGNKIMVHSNYAYEKVREYAENVKKINMIPQIKSSETLIDRKKLYNKYKIPENAFVFASFGMIEHTKLNRNVCAVIQKMVVDREFKDIIYVMVGQGNVADAYVDGKHIFKTGFVSLEEFDSFMEYADVVINLRHPSMGETSAAMLRVFQKGKPCITNNGGWFSEIPDDSVYKVDLDHLENDLEEVMKKMIDDSYRKEFGRKARNLFEKEYQGELISQEIYRFVVGD